ncbi:MAG: SPOR domain-containing protein [Eubacteriales bacterium]|nr:SPOR domain-containing protein [Eubacteriales bacterium]
MWTVIHIVQNKEDAKDLAQRLEQVGIISRIKHVNKSVGGGAYEVLVPAAEVQKALGLIIDSEF